MIENLKNRLCQAFCGGLQAHVVPCGLAISTLFEDSSGDRISFYLSEAPDGYVLEDDGSYLADLIARDIPINYGPRGDMLDAILQEGEAFWDRDTYEIRTDAFSEESAPRRAMAFLSSLIRVRDLALVTRERVRSAFRDDFIHEVKEKFGQNVEIEENVAPANDLKDYPADVVIRANGMKTAAVYLVNSDAKLNEALLAWIDRGSESSDIAMIGLLEDSGLHAISRKRFGRAQNKKLPMPIFRDDKEAAMQFIRSEMQLAA